MPRHFSVGLHPFLRIGLWAESFYFYFFFKSNTLFPATPYSLPLQLVSRSLYSRKSAAAKALSVSDVRSDTFPLTSYILRSFRLSHQRSLPRETILL